MSNENKPTYAELELKLKHLEQLEQEHRNWEILLQDEINWRRQILEESRDGIVILDKEAKVYESNTRFAQMLGYRKHEVYQLYVWDWDSHFSKHQILQMAESADRSGERFETRHRKKDGEVIDVELSTNGVRYRGNKLIFCIARDITARKKAEQEREQLLKQYESAKAENKALKAILPQCSFCKKIRDDSGHWEQVEIFIKKHFDTDISHGICPECLQANYPEFST